MDGGSERASHTILSVLENNVFFRFQRFTKGNNCLGWSGDYRIKEAEN